MSALTVKVIANLKVIDLMTDAQRRAVETLTGKPTADRIVLFPDQMYDGALLFTLYGNRSKEDVFLHGLIEPDGSVNT